MKRLLARLARRPATPAFTAALAPAQPLAAVGDVHGCDGVLASMLEHLQAEGGRQIVMLGDYIDRGDESAQVLRRLAGRPDLICLRGNHEAMCLEFVAEPEMAGPRWLRNGGLQTLASFGIGGLGPGAGPAVLRDAATALETQMGPELLGWLEGLPTYWQSGNVACLHAAADPAVSLAMQQEDHLLWGHPDFVRRSRADGIWVVHGHTIVPEPSATNGKIAVDTGAYATGRLSAALISAGEVVFVSQRAGEACPKRL